MSILLLERFPCARPLRSPFQSHLLSQPYSRASATCLNPRLQRDLASTRRKNSVSMVFRGAPFENHIMKELALTVEVKNKTMFVLCAKSCEDTRNVSLHRLVTSHCELQRKKIHTFFHLFILCISPLSLPKKHTRCRISVTMQRVPNPGFSGWIPLAK